jgi:YegS/Rv2252/BmrU family lipid kinase
MSAFVIVNPHSASGKTRRDWRSLEPALASVYPYMSVAFTRRRGEATALVAAALREGHSEIVAVGGDATMNEAVNGFFDAEGSVSPDAVLAFIASGAESDFKQAFGVPESGDPISLLKHAHIRPIDVGRARFLSKEGVPRTRYFANIASFGLSGLIVDRVNRSPISGLFGPGFSFGLQSILALTRYRGRAVRLIVDSVFDEIVNISTVAVANGRVFGAGMQVAPEAQPDDGQFDVVIINNGPAAQMLADLKLITSGEHLSNPNVRLIRGRRVVAAPVAETRGRPVLIETDGACVGRLPATFEILPRALNVRC